MEQSYKEKYEQALEKIKNLIDKDHNDISVDDILNVFPELTESEDEKIRKWIINEIKIKHHNLDEENVDFVDKAIAWLEKQGEQKTEENKGNIEGISPNWSEEDKGIIEEVVSYLINYSNIVESKEDADRIEYLIDKIQDICPHQKQEWSEEDEPQKGLAESYLAKFDEKFPILPTLKGKRLADYKNFLNKCQQIFGLKYWGIRPTQAKLFEKLSLLWAAWGAEHLQGLGQTDGDMDDEILWSEEDEENFCSVYLDVKSARQNTVNSLSGELKEQEQKRMDEVISWLKSLKPQNQWKPSDVQIECLSDAIEHYNSLGYPAPKLKELLDDLKKLKGEV